LVTLCRKDLATFGLTFATPLRPVGAPDGTSTIRAVNLHVNGLASVVLDIVETCCGPHLVPTAVNIHAVQTGRTTW
jgi:hypothetical protein